MKTQNKLQDNCNIIKQNLKEQTGWNKARIFVIVELMIAIIKIGRVNLKKVAIKINPMQSKEANYRRLNRFFQHFTFDKTMVAKLMASFLDDGKWVLTMDRTNWKFGRVHINILMLAVAHKGIAIPIVWFLLFDDKKNGNSSYKDRVRVMKTFIDIFGVEKIEVLVADREFIGKKWFKWLKKYKIPFAIRIKDGHKIITNKGEKSLKELFRDLKENTPTYYQRQLEIYGYQGLFLVAIKHKGECVVIATNTKQEKAIGYYKRRWEIETLFSAFKKRGFNLEETHMTERKKIYSLLVILSLAFVWCHIVGEWLNETKPIKILKHGRKAKSLFLHGFEYLDEIFSNYEFKIKELAKVVSLFKIEVKNDDY